MNSIFRIATRIYGFLLHLYPTIFRKEFEEQMFLDFSDMLSDASKKGGISFAVFCLSELIDFPANLLRIYWREGGMFRNTPSKEDQVTTVFHSGPVRSAFQAAFALGIALILMWSIIDWILSFMQDQGWTFLLQIANSRGWKLDYNSSAQTIVYYAALILGALLAGLLLAICLREKRQIVHYLIAGFLGLVAPLILIHFFGSILKINDQAFRNTLIDVTWIILAGLGFGLMFSMILRDRQKIPWLLLSGVFGYYVANNIALWLLTPLFPTYAAEAFTWNDLVYVIGIYGITGLILGGILGAVSGWPTHKSALA